MTKVIPHPTTMQVGEPNPKPLVDTEEHYRNTGYNLFVFLYKGYVQYF